MADNRYCIEYAKTGRSGCKKCKSIIEKGAPRVGKITPNPFNDDGGDMKVWYHMRCIFETLKVSFFTSQESGGSGYAYFLLTHFTLELSSPQISNSPPFFLQRARTAKKIETPADIEGFPELKDEEKDEIKKLIAEFDVPKPSPKATKTKGKGVSTSAKTSSAGGTQTLLSKPSSSGKSIIFIF